MSDSNETVADLLELKLLNQHAIAAGLEDMALWIEARGSVDTHDKITNALEQLDVNADAITAAIEKAASKSSTAYSVPSADQKCSHQPRNASSFCRKMKGFLSLSSYSLTVSA